MPPSTEAVYGLSPVVGQATVDTANTNRDGTGAIVTIVTGGANGTRIDYVIVKNFGTTQAGLIVFYIDDGAGNIFVYDEVDVSGTVAGSGTVASWRNRTNFGLVLPSGKILKASITVTRPYRIFAHGADL